MGLIKIRLAMNGNTIEVEGEKTEVEDVLKNYFLNSQHLGDPAVTVGASDVKASFFALLQKEKYETELELMLGLAYFIDKEAFSREELLQAYKQTKTYSTNRSKSLSLNIRKCLKKDWFLVVGRDVYAIAPAGKKHLKEIVGR